MILYKSSLPKIDIKLLTLQYLLDSPELINYGNLIDICIETYDDKVIYKLLFKTKNNFDVFKLRELARNRKTVVLPQPEGPRIVTNSPLLIVRLKMVYMLYLFLHQASIRID